MFTVLINPRSGGGAGASVLEKFDRGLADQAFDGWCGAIDFAALDAQLDRAEKSDALFVAGGDGTVSSVIAEWRRRGSEVPLGVLPLGTGNDLARELGTFAVFDWRSPVEGMWKIAAFSRQELQSWNVTFPDRPPHCLVNYLSLGFDGAVVSGFEAWRRRAGSVSGLLGVIRNRIAYAFYSLTNIGYRLDAPRIEILADGSSSPHGGTQYCTSALSLLITNIKSCMGLGISHPDASPFEGRINMQINRSILNYLSMLTSHRLGIFMPVSLGSATSWRITNLPSGMPFQLDGEASVLTEAGEIKVSAAERVVVFASK